MGTGAPVGLSWSALPKPKLRAPWRQLERKFTIAKREYTLFRQDQIPNNNPYTPLGIVLSAGRALLDSVVQPLRAVSVDASRHRFQVFFIYDEPLTEDQEEECRCVGTELLADYPTRTSDHNTLIPKAIA